MAEIQKVGDLEIDQDLAFQRREWGIQRLAWALMALLVLLGLVGLFGPGPLSSTTVGQPGLSASFYRFVRYEDLTTLRLELQPSGSEARLWLSRGYAQAAGIQRINPEPEQVLLEPDRQVYVFAVGQGEGPVRVSFSLQPEQMGRLEGQIGLEGQGSLEFWQWVFP